MNIPSHTGDDYTRKTAAAEPSAADEARQEREEELRERRRLEGERIATFAAACNALSKTDRANAYIVVKALEVMFRP